MATRQDESRKGRVSRGRAVWLHQDAYAALEQRARAAGVPVAQMLSTIVLPPAFATPSAQEAARLVQLADVLRQDDVDGARAFLHDALLELRRWHAVEIRDGATDWSG